jgi:hypothetical protein
MSTFQKKYYYDFKSVDNKSHTVEIWQDTSTGISATKVIGASDPFIVTMPSLENKFQPVRGSGADLGLFATTSMQYMDLYTANIQEYQVRHYIDSVLNWCGYLDTEIFSSDISRQKNYSVAITANDGFALLDRLYYVQLDGSHYTGISSQFDILKLILNRLNLPFTYIYIYLSTVITGVTNGEGESLLNHTYVMNSNFYNEDGEASTLREVLESILKPYGAFITQSNSNLYILDNQGIVNDGLGIVQYFTDNLNTYVTDITLTELIGDLDTIGFASNSQTLNIIPGVKKAVVAYSPYKEKEIINYDASEDFKNNSGMSTTRGAVNYQWTEYDYITTNNSTYWEKDRDGYFMGMIGLDGENTEVKDYYLNIVSNSSYIHTEGLVYDFRYKRQLPNVIGTDDFKLKIELSVYPRISNDLNNTLTNDQISSVRLLAKLKIGDMKYWYGIGIPGDTWVDASTHPTLDLILPVTNKVLGLADYSKQYAAIEDRWTDLKVDVNHNYDNNVDRNDFLIPLPKSLLTGGLLEFEIYGFQILDMYGAVRGVPSLRIKDIRLTIVDLFGHMVNESDTEYVGYMNAQYKNEGSSIELIQGTNVYDFPIERGGLLTYDVSTSTYSWIKQWTRATVTDNIENLLLRSYVGNYENKSIELTATTKLLTNNIGYLTYTLPSTTNGKKFMITSAKHDYANNKSELTMQEIFPDSLTINKSF